MKMCIRMGTSVFKVVILGGISAVYGRVAVKLNLRP